MSLLIPSNKTTSSYYIDLKYEVLIPLSKKTQAIRMIFLILFTNLKTLIWNNKLLKEFNSKIMLHNSIPLGTSRNESKKFHDSAKQLTLGQQTHTHTQNNNSNESLFELNFLLNRTTPEN